MESLAMATWRARVARHTEPISPDQILRKKISDLQQKNNDLTNEIETLSAESNAQIEEIKKLTALLNIEISGAMPIKECAINQIIEEVADYYNVSVLDLISPRRIAELIEPRHVAMYLAKKITVKSLPVIGRAFGNRDHSTVLAGARKIEFNRKFDPLLDQTISRIERTIRAKYEQEAGG